MKLVLLVLVFVLVIVQKQSMLLSSWLGSATRPKSSQVMASNTKATVLQRGLIQLQIKFDLSSSTLLHNYDAYYILQA
jgi:preprotein translocase subunit SecG